MGPAICSTAGSIARPSYRIRGITWQLTDAADGAFVNHTGTGTCGRQPRSEFP